ncbi:MAG TPA: hypothetical protein VFI91_06395 [Longimicrobiaceae bacterium]|nr:hypothetical protein [Longimicrobiaceae bacterium]
MSLNKFVLVILLASGLSACGGDPFFRRDPVLATDTIEVAAPTPANEGLPTALDITTNGFSIAGGRFPERTEDAQRWDFAIRLEDGNLVFKPLGAFGIDSRAAITRPLGGETFEGLEEAPPLSAFVSDSTVVIEMGAVYAARSREPATGCSQYGKLQPLEVNVATGRVKLVVTTNGQCGDPRLVPVD